MTAVHYGDVAAVLAWLDEPKKRGKEYRTARRIDATCIMQLQNKGEAAGSFADVTILMLACATNNAHLVAEVIQRRASLDLQDSRGSTALMLAADNDSVDIVRLLLEAGAETSIRNAKGQTALQIAHRKGYTQCMHAFQLHVALKVMAKRNEEVDAQRRVEAEAALRAASEGDSRPLLQEAIAANAEAAEAGGFRSAALADARMRLDEIMDRESKKEAEQRKELKAQKKQRQRERKRQISLGKDFEGVTLEEPKDAAVKNEAAPAGWSLEEPEDAAGKDEARPAAVPVVNAPKEGVSDVHSDHDHEKFAAAAVMPPQIEPTPTTTNRDVDEECIVCFESPRTHVFFPCGHLIVCEACADMIAPNGRGACPICKTPGGVASRMTHAQLLYAKIHGCRVSGGF